MSVKRTIMHTQGDISLFCQGFGLSCTQNYIMQTQTKRIKSLELVIKIKLTINVPFHSTARSLPPLAGHGHRKPSKCEQPLASTLQEMTVQQATQMHPADTSGPCGFHEQTNCKITKRFTTKLKKDMLTSNLMTFT